MNDLGILLKQKQSYERNDPLAAYKPCHANSEAFHASSKKNRWIFGGNRSSKSVSSITDMIRVALGRHPLIRIPVPNSGRVVGVDMEHGIQDVLYPLIKLWAPKGSIKRVGRNSRGVPNQIVWITGSITELRSCEQDVLSFESKALDYVVFDEPPPKPIYTANMARLVDRGGYMWGAMTLIGSGDKDSPFNDNWTWIFDDIYEPWDAMSEDERIEDDTDIFVFDTYDNKHLRREDIRAFEKKLSDAEREARIHGKFINLLGRIHPTFEREEPWIIPSAVIPFDWPWYEAIDINPKRGHAYVAATVSPEGQLIFCEEILTKPNDTVEDFAKQIQGLRDMGEGDKRKPLWTLVDHNAYAIESTSKTSIANELQRHGIVVSPAHKGQESVFAGINRVNTLLKKDAYADSTKEGIACKPNLVIMSHLTNTIYQLYNYTWGKNNKPKDVYKDFPDAVRYLVMGNPTHTGQAITMINEPPKTFYSKKRKPKALRNVRDANSYLSILR